MTNQPSHDTRARVGLGLIALCVAGAATYGAFLWRRSLVETEALQTARQSSTALTIAIEDRIADVRARALQRNLTDELLHWAQLDIEGGKIRRVEDAMASPKLPKEFNSDRYFQSSSELLPWSHWATLTQALTFIAPDTNRNQEWLAFVFKASQGSKSALLALVDPTAWVPTEARAYLVNPSGRVLSHAVKSYVGTSLRDTDIFEKGLKSLFLSSRKERSGKGMSVDQLPVAYFAARVADLPLVVVTEVPLPSLNLVGLFHWSWLLGYAALAWAFLQLDDLLRRRAARSQAVLATDVFVTSALLQKQNWDSSESLKLEIQSQSVAQTEAAEVFDQFEQFEIDASTLQELREPKAMARRVAKLASDLMGRPVLFFIYHPLLDAAILQAHAGILESAGKVEGMSFVLNERALQHVQDSEAEGAIASLAHYPPIQELLKQRLGMEQSTSFDAWVLTGKSSGKSRVAILGVVVALAREDEILPRESLARLVRLSRTAYERTLTRSL